MALESSGGLAAVICGLLSLGAIPGRLANRHPRQMGWMTIAGSGLALAACLAGWLQLARTGRIDATWLRVAEPIPLQVGLYLDQVALLMAGLIGLLGMVIARYSLTYLSGDPRHGQFFRWMSFTLGATLLLVASGNLVMLTLAWMMTSYGLHQLLTYFPERSWAVWAARKKFLISRLGDVLLLTGLCLTYYSFGTTEYRELFAAAEAVRGGIVPHQTAIFWIAIVFVLGAMTKSAQFPFHTWLPDTMETPTPVSALMHAGVINAGGFLVIRLSPLISLEPLALDLLALVGAVTALSASVVMLTQTSIKRSLAYSTIAQMGFMMLQCGLGAFSAAMLHIVAHSAYKAHAFLSCGSVLDAAAGRKAIGSAAESFRHSAVAFFAALGLSAAALLGTWQIMGLHIWEKGGAAVLGLVLLLALTQNLWQALRSRSIRLWLRGVVQTVLVSAAYAAAYLIIDRLISPSTAHPAYPVSTLNVIVMSFVAAGFLAVFALQALGPHLSSFDWMQALYVHAMNGFYLDIPARRVTAWFYRQSAPVQ
jgi:NAD(P)H-quinone oxidoreductase subunit 5